MQEYPMIQNIIDSVKDKKYVYVTQDLQHIYPLLNIFQNLFVVTTQNGCMVDVLGKKFPGRILSLDSKYNSVRLLEEYLDGIGDKNKDEYIFQTFKPTKAFLSLLDDYNLNYLHPKSVLNWNLEHKIDQFKIMGEDMYPYQREIIKLKDISFGSLVDKFGKEFILQWQRGHSGEGTRRITRQAEYEDLREAFPNRRALVSEILTGDTFTINCCIYKGMLYIGGLSRQITGVMELSTLPYSTVGNNSKHGVDSKYKVQILQMLENITRKLIKVGFSGMFGVDFMLVENKVAIVEINPRQVMSIGMDTQIQLTQGRIPLFLIHLAEFLDVDLQISADSYNKDFLREQKYSQVLYRNGERGSKINTSFKSGRYECSSGEIRYVDDNLALASLERDQILIMFQGGGTLKQNAEVFRIQVPFSVQQEDGLLAPEIGKIIKDVEASFL